MDLTTLDTAIVPSTSLEFTLTVVIAGIGVVLGMLVLLIVIFSLYGKLMSKSGKKSTKQEQISTEIAVATAPVAKAEPVAQDGISGEIVAAISAAIYALEGENAQICSITPVAATVGTPAPARKTSPLKSRNPWAMAAIVDNTRAF